MTSTLSSITTSAVSATSSQLKLEVLPGWEEIATDWKSLELTIANERFACGSTWVKSWLDQYQSSITPYFLKFTSEDRLIATVLVVGSTHCKEGPFSLRTLHLGTAGEAHGHSACIEYNTLLCAKQDRPQVLALLLEWMHKQKQYNEIRLDGIEHDLLEEVQSLKTPSTALELTERMCRSMEFAAVREADQMVIDQLGKSTRQNLRRRIRKMGEPHVEWATSTDQALRIFQELVELHQQRWTEAGQPGAFASERFYRLQESYIKAGHASGACHLARVRIEGSTLGCVYYWNDRNRLLDYVSGFASFSEFPSGGLVTHYLCLEDALVRGFTGYDFLVGDKQHKVNLGKTETPLYWVRFKKPHWKYIVLKTLRTIKRTLQSLRPQNVPPNSH